MLKPSVFIGAGSASGTTVTLTGANLTAVGPSAGYPTHFLMIKSGTGAGYFSDVTSFTSTSVTLADDLSSFITSDTSLAVIPHYKLSEVLTNLTSVLAGGSAASSADNVLVINPTTGKLDTLYYKTGIGAGWKTSANANADTAADISNGFVVKRRSTTNAVFSQTKSW